MAEDAHLPIGLSREEGGGTRMAIVDDVPRECPKCGAALTAHASGSSSWGRPSRPLTKRCRECGQEYELRLVPVEP